MAATPADPQNIRRAQARRRLGTALRQRLHKILPAVCRWLSAPFTSEPYRVQDSGEYATGEHWPVWTDDPDNRARLARWYERAQATTKTEDTHHG